MVTAISAAGCRTPQDAAERLPIVNTASVAAVVMLTVLVLVEKTMNHNGGVWRDGKYRQAVTGINYKLFCMFCSPAFWAEALATGFVSCGMNGDSLPRLAVQPLQAPPPAARDPQLLPDSAAASAATSAGGDHSAAAAAVSAAPEVPPPFRGTDSSSNPPPAIPACPPSPPPPQSLVVNPPCVPPHTPHGPQCMSASSHTLPLPSPSLLQRSTGLSKGHIQAVTPLHFPPPLPKPLRLHLEASGQGCVPHFLPSLPHNPKTQAINCIPTPPLRPLSSPPSSPPPSLFSHSLPRPPSRPLPYPFRSPLISLPLTYLPPSPPLPLPVQLNFGLPARVREITTPSPIHL